MISTFYVENYTLTRVLLLIAAVGVVLLATVLARAGSAGRRFAGWIAAAAMASVLAVTLYPDGPAAPGPRTCNVEPSSFYNDIPNVALLFFPAVFATLALPRVWMAVVGVLALPALIELFQYLAPGLNRRCDIDDWLSNTIGGLVGVAVAAGLMALVRRGRERRPVSES